MKRIITLIIIAAGLALAGPAAASTNCHAIMTTSGYHDSYTSTIDVQVSRYLGMPCNRALRIGAAAYLHPGLHPIYGPQFGGGGFGGSVPRWPSVLLKRPCACVNRPRAWGPTCEVVVMKMLIISIVMGVSLSGGIAVASATVRMPTSTAVYMSLQARPAVVLESADGALFLAGYSHT